MGLFDPLGILNAASAINQYRVHSGYHYPRSPETILETLEARAEFINAYSDAIVRNSRHYYAIPRENSRTSPEQYERAMASHHLALRPHRPSWMNFDYIDRCYEVDENIYDPNVLCKIIEAKLRCLKINFHKREFPYDTRADYDFIIWATYGMGPSRKVFKIAKYQVAEKILIELPAELRGVALVVVDGPFTAFDPYGDSTRSLFGSAKLTNHWTSTNPDEPVPAEYAAVLNCTEFKPFSGTRFEAMCRDASLTVPATANANYIGSRFTIRVVEDNPDNDRRILHIRDGLPGEIHIFSGKVVSAVKAAKLLCERLAQHE